jgi:glycosyltransferase involved in cell wall biosynthesis
MLVKDEADIIGTTVPHLLASVDEVIVSDNGSTDRTLLELAEIGDGRITIFRDEEVGYYQSRKMSALADAARSRGHEWVLPCDADEIWHVCAPI